MGFKPSCLAQSYTDTQQTLATCPALHCTRSCLLASQPVCCDLRDTVRAWKPDLIADTVREAPHCWQRRNMMREALSLSNSVSGLLQLLHSTYLQKCGRGRGVAASMLRGKQIRRKRATKPEQQPMHMMAEGRREVAHSFMYLRRQPSNALGWKRPFTMRRCSPSSEPAW